MPLYNYLCHSCGNSFESFAKMADRHNVEKEPCEKCGESKIKIALSPTLWMDPYVLGKVKPKEDFMQRIKQIKKSNKGNTIDV